MKESNPEPAVSVQRFFLHLSYDGSPYCGWQKQPRVPSVQESLEKALGTLLKKEVEVVGCGRTDTGVHARSYFAHFDWEGEPIGFERRKSWVYQLNALLDRQIAVDSVFEVPAGFHARFSATGRTYHYYLHTRKDPFLDAQSYYCRAPFDAEKIRSAARRLRTYEDFTSFSKLHTQTRTNLCNLTRADFLSLDENRWVFVFTANRFLRNMVRAMVGTLLGVGFGKYSVEDLDAIVRAKDRCKAGVSVPAHALFLQEITYF